jgi:hypothetical protein
MLSIDNNDAPIPQPFYTEIDDAIFNIAVKLDMNSCKENDVVVNIESSPIQLS